MAASSSMISTEPADELSLKLGRGIVASSDIDSLPRQRKIQVESCAPAGMALHANLSRMFLNNSVGHGQAQACAFALAFARRRLRREKRIVDALDVLLGNAGPGVSHDYA